MKRPSDFEQAVIEIVEEGKAKDEEGHALYPVMEEPMVKAFFGAYNTLYETLIERPILVLNLIRTNKALEMFWSMFEGMWIKMIDNILEREVNRRFADTHPFFAIENLRARQALAPLMVDLTPEMIERFPLPYRYGDADFLSRSIFTNTPFNVPGKLLGAVLPRENEWMTYQVIYYDPLTKLYIQLLQQIEYLRQYSRIVNNVGLSIFHIESCLENYIEWESVYSDIDCLDDCFLVNVTDGPKLLQQNLDNMIHYVEWLDMLLNPERVPETLAGKSRSMWLDAHILAGRLLRLLRDHFNGTVPIVQEAFKPLELDKTSLKSYYVSFYDKDQGLYNTPEKQRTLLTAVLRNTYRNQGYRGDMIEKYGQATPLRCAVCHTETHYVDTAMMRAFCTEQCRSFYTK